MAPAGRSPPYECAQLAGRPLCDMMQAGVVKAPCHCHVLVKVACISTCNKYSDAIVIWECWDY